MSSVFALDVRALERAGLWLAKNQSLNEDGTVREANRTELPGTQSYIGYFGS